jgi:hypothetical protein
MLKSKWVMLCPMARSGSSHTSELLGFHHRIRSHHGLFNDGPFGRWPANEYLAPEQMEYYSSILDDRFQRVGGQEHSGEFLDKFIFTDDRRFNPRWECIGFKIQFVHFVHMPDLREYLIRNQDIKIIVNTRRHLLEHACAEYWCQNGNSRAARSNENYSFGNQTSIRIAPQKVLATFRNLCRYRQYAIHTFGTGTREFFEWSYEDMFQKDGSLSIENHQRLFDFLGMKPTIPFASTFTKTPRPAARQYLENYEEIQSYVQSRENGIFSKYFLPDYDPWKDHSWPVLRDYQLDNIMVEKDNSQFRP